MRKHIVRALTVLLLLLAVAVQVSAHEHRDVGDYELVFGWRVEPAYTSLLNGPEIFVSDANGNPVEGLEDTLSLDVTFGPATKHLHWRSVWGDPGHYTADLIPTRPGDYVFTVTGTIGETTVNEVFDSSDGDFSSVEPVEDIQFPQ